MLIKHIHRGLQMRKLGQKFLIKLLAFETAWASIRASWHEPLNDKVTLWFDKFFLRFCLFLHPGVICKIPLLLFWYSKHSPKPFWSLKANIPESKEWVMQSSLEKMIISSQFCGKKIWILLWQVFIILEASKYLQHKILEHSCYGISNINFSNQKVYVQFY